MPFSELNVSVGVTRLRQHVCTASCTAIPWKQSSVLFTASCPIECVSETANMLSLRAAGVPRNLDSGGRHDHTQKMCGYVS